MTPAELRALIRELSYDSNDVAALTNMLNDHKTGIYANTLEALAEQHGYTLDAGGVQLGQDTLIAIREDAREGAEQIVSTYNAELRAFLESQRSATLEEADAAAAAWSAQRAEAKAQLIADTEAYPAHADAVLSFYEAAGQAPTYNFGGSGKCALCQAITANNPHPHEDVVTIGNPHPGCADTWTANVSDAELSDEIHLGQQPAGILGQQPLIIRHGTRQAAIDAVDALPGA